MFRELDATLDAMWESSQQSRSTLGEYRPHQSLSKANHEIEQCLMRATYAYASRWLSRLDPPIIDVEESEINTFVRESWRTAREDMLRVLNRVSYRSVLTLYLFSQTPVPVDITENEELNGVSGVVCIQMALLQLQQLRSRRRSHQYHGSDLSSWSSALMTAFVPPITDYRMAFLNLESRVYWAAVSWDICSSLTLELNASLTTGLKGACAEPVWVLARGFLVESFHVNTEEWRQGSFELSGALVSQILSGANICRAYVWRTIASVKEALREGFDEDRVVFAWTAFQDALKVFKTTIEPLLDCCEKQLHFQSQTNRFSWYHMILHHHLGILILVHAVEAADRLDLLSDIDGVRLEAEYATLNALDFGLKSTYTIKEPNTASNLDSMTEQCMESSSTTSGSSSRSNRFRKSTCIIAIDPYPHHVLASVQLVYMAIHRKYHAQTITGEVHNNLSSILMRSLDQLPSTSRSVLVVREKIQQLIGGNATPARCPSTSPQS